MGNTIIDNPYFQNVSSEFIAIAIIIVFGWAIYSFTGRRKLHNIFNIGKTKRITIYMSKLRISLGGAIGIDGITRSFAEDALPLSEAHLIPAFQRLFNFIIPGIDSMPGILRRLFISDIDVNIQASPLSVSEIDREVTFIAIGSPGYNIASKRIEDDFNPAGVFSTTGNGIIFSGSLRPDLRCSFVQRVCNQESGQIAYYVAGLSSYGTIGAVYYLIKNWKALHEKYPDGRPFSLYIRVLGNDAKQADLILEG